MTQLIINTGLTPNDKSADSLYSAFNKVNSNFTELYGLGGSASPLNIDGGSASSVYGQTDMLIDGGGA